MADDQRLQSGTARRGRDQQFERSLALRDEEAVAWFRTRGVECEPRGPLYLFADRVADGPFELLRVWHTPARVERRLGPRTSSRAEAVIQIDGIATVTTSSQSLTLEPNHMALLPANRSWSLDAAAATARIEIRSRPGLWPIDDSRHDIETVAAGSTALLDILVATAISALSSGLRPNDAGFSSFRSAIETLVASLASMRSAATEISAEESLLRAALELIEKEAADPTLTVASLAERLLVSRRHLHRAFAGHTATPLAEIHAARVALAQKHFDLRAHRSGVDHLEVAQHAGFRTVRALNKALREHRSA